MHLSAQKELSEGGVESVYREIQTPEIQGFLRNFALRLCFGDLAAAEDLLQTTCTQACAKAHQFKFGTNFKGWLGTIMRNKKNSLLRRSQIVSFVAISDVKEVGRRQDYDREIFYDEVEDVIDSLEDRVAYVMAMRFREETPYEDLAERLDCPVGTIKSMITRAKKKLRLLLKDEVF